MIVIVARYTSFAEVRTSTTLSLSFLEYAPCVRVRQRVRELSTLPVATLDVSSAHWYRSCKLQRLVTAV